MGRFGGRVVPLLIGVGLIVTGCGNESRQAGTATATSPPRSSSGSADPPGESAAPPTRSQAPPESPPAATTPSPRPEGVLVAGRYQPLWPFSGPEEVADWERAYRAEGREAWRLDAARTALAFTRDYLGFTDIDRAVKTVREGRHARVHVGSTPEEGSRPLVAAIVHLIRYGSGEHAPWEVVGTDDTTFSLTVPRYGASVGSPLTVGGRITGVDESVRVQVRHPGTAEPVGESCCVSAGGENAPWSGRVAFRAAPGRTLTVVVSTGGHVAPVERFAVTGVTT
ncbi:hypothetical protein [Nonomuraea jiangxiensis]|uniref:Uncharacterized protein n=1 Tax=Nonomuraea jiangxiensis TaxID=633440 RepID=A0A1G9APA6_9ACTN|nr:hypothetical protein [Nonomuraea jiangxiensis]SDK29216.1 hypothetical protein SAMN05421869_11516 [Nonomuraea jiangxiensis]